MPDSTPGGLPYPIPSDQVAQYPATGRALAEAIETMLASNTLTVPAAVQTMQTVDIYDNGHEYISPAFPPPPPGAHAALVLVTLANTGADIPTVAKWALRVGGTLDNGGEYYGTQFGYSGNGRPQIPPIQPAQGPKSYAFMARLAAPAGRTITALQIKFHAFNADMRISVWDASITILGTAT